MYNVIKCWDIAAAYMHAGQMLRIECPAYLAYGGQWQYGHFDMDIINKDKPLIFEFDVLECEHSVEKINAANLKSKNRAPKVYHGYERH